MTDIQFRSDMSVDLVDSMGTDAAFVAAARVSVVGSEAAMFENASPGEFAGLINYLMKHRHGTPFEHAVMKFRVEAPIFVYREWHRHRVWSYNEMSGRYSQLEPVFHIPAPDRPLVNIGTSARPKMAAGSLIQYGNQVARMKRVYTTAYLEYLQALNEDVAKEVAREILPVGIYSTMYATANVRALFHFLSLRTSNEEATFVSHPQYEIEQAAIKVEAAVAEQFPLAHAAFVANGRVSP